MSVARAGNDQRVVGLFPDASADHHILMADGEGAQAILDLFAHCRSQMHGRIVVVYADTASSAANYALLLCKQDVDRIEVLPTRLGAIRLLSTMVEGPKIGFRLYAAGTGVLIGLVRQLAEARGLEPMSVITQRRTTAGLWRF